MLDSGCWIVPRFGETADNADERRSGIQYLASSITLIQNSVWDRVRDSDGERQTANRSQRQHSVISDSAGNCTYIFGFNRRQVMART